MADPELAQILAGPILRRTDASGAWVWLATSQAVHVKGSVYDAKSTLGAGATPAPLAAGEASSMAFGASLHLTLVGMLAPKATPLLPRQMLAYNLVCTPKTGAAYQLDSSDELKGINRIGYAPYALPTFFIPDAKTVNLLHGSCRKADGPDADAMAAADTLMSAHVDDFDARPSALFLTGDQIYADDVANAIAGPVLELGGRLLGFGEKTPLFKEPDPAGKGGDEVRISHLTDGDRGRLVADVFTPDNRYKSEEERWYRSQSTARNQLIGFGEYAAMHLLGWSPALWAPKVGDANADVASFKGTVVQVRRALANIPTYMMLDDHEVTDDWNRTKAWQKRAEAVPIGRRVIANGIVAFWAFQAWGNDPSATRPTFVDPASLFFAGGTADADAEAYAKPALAYSDFSFVAPTHPPAVVVDMRTTRGPDPGDLVAGRAPDPDAPPELLGKKALDAFVQRAKSACAPGKLLLVVAPAPVVGFAQWERPQEFLPLTPLKTADTVDLESWHANPASYHRFLLAIAEQVQPGACVFLSGDVHFGHVAKAVLTARAQPGKPPRRLGFAQFTSSALKNRHPLYKRALLNVANVFVPDLDPEWVWRSASTDPHDSLPKVALAVKGASAKAIADNGPPDYTHRSYGVGETSCSDAPLLLTGSNIGQLEMADADPTTSARFTFLAPSGAALTHRDLFLDWRPSLRPRSQ